MRKFLEYGGLIAGVVMVLFGVATLAMAFDGRSTVRDSLRDESIVGTPDMTPAAIATEAKASRLPASISLPTCNVAGKTIDTGSRARCFASYMRIHALEATGGQTYSQMGRYIDKAGKPTSDVKAAAVNAKGQPVENPLRQLWVTETALSTALNVSFMAEQLSLFAAVVGTALFLTGVGFLVLTLGGALRARIASRESATAPLAPVAS